MRRIMVLGGQGQLGLCLQRVVATGKIKHKEYVFPDEREADVTNKSQLQAAFENFQPEYVINCSAFTAVDKAEDEKEKAEMINSSALSIIADLCNEYDVTLIHISTDFVFDGTKNQPLTEEYEAFPINVYGVTKLMGEKVVQEQLSKFFIIRTSWLYSEFANNFMKTMLRIASEKSVLNVVNDQIGTPTYAIDLANVIVKIIDDDFKKYGIYHFSNEGMATWYDFAYEIFHQAGITIDLQPINTEGFPTKAQRPVYSVLDKTKIKSELGIRISHWKESLQASLSALKHMEN